LSRAILVFAQILSYAIWSPLPSCFVTGHRLALFHTRCAIRGWIERAASGSSLMLTARARRPVNAPYRKAKTCPHPDLWLEDVCAPGYTGRKRGEVVRTRTVVAQAHSSNWLGSFGNRGNGRYRTELRQALTAIMRYLTAHHLPPAQALLRLDGQYGTGAVLADVTNFAFVTRGKDYTVLDHPLVQARLHLPPDQIKPRLESQVRRSLYDCPQVPVGSEGVRCRVVVATHPAGKKKSPVGVTRAGVVYELFFTTLPQQGFTASDVVELYLHRGAFEPQQASEDQELDPDRWCSHTACGQEAWCIVSQWVWNLRLELGHRLSPTPLRTTEFAPALSPQGERTASRSPSSPPAAGYGPPTAATCLGKQGAEPSPTFLSSRMGRCAVQQESLFTLRSSKALLAALCAWSMRPAFATAARVRCASNVNGMEARLRSQSPRECAAASAPGGFRTAAATRDWSRREHRRACIQLARHQRLEVSLSPPTATSPPAADVILSRAQRAHSRRSWAERLARNARSETVGQVTIKLFGMPVGFATSLGLATA
jgi:hypothetical protein